MNTTISPQSPRSADTESTEQKKRKRWTADRTDALFDGLNSSMSREEFSTLFAMTFGALQSVHENRPAARVSEFFDTVERMVATCAVQKARQAAAA